MARIRPEVFLGRRLDKLTAAVLEVAAELHLLRREQQRRVIEQDATPQAKRELAAIDDAVRGSG